MIKPVVYNITLDIYKVGSQKVISMVRGDTKRKIVISLMEHDRPYVLTKGMVANFTALKPDGNFIYNACEIDVNNNTIIYNVTEQTTAVNGKVSCQLRLVGENGGIISSPSFVMVVDDLLYNEEDIVDSASEFNALTAYIASLQKMVADGKFNGKSIFIRSSFELTDEDEIQQWLNAKVEDAESGDGYIAGNNHLYVFDGEKFVDVGLVRGPQGLSGVYVGGGDMPENYNVQIDPDGASLTMDSTIKSDSVNPVEGKAIYAALEKKADVTMTIHTYKRLSYIGVTVGETTGENAETIENIATRLNGTGKYNTMLLYGVDSNNANIYPLTSENYSYGIARVTYLDEFRVLFEYFDKVYGKSWIGVHAKLTSGGYSWTGWVRTATSGDITPLNNDVEFLKGRVDLLGDYASNNTDRIMSLEQKMENAETWLGALQEIVNKLEGKS